MADSTLVYALLGFLLLERGVELLIARRNAVWMFSRGAREHDGAFTKALTAFHGAWFLSFAVEAHAGNTGPLIGPGWIILIALVLQAGRYWCIASLGRFWNTGVIVLPRAGLVRRGPYRYLRHPNYAVVAVEIFLYPTLSGCWRTGVLFGALNLLMLRRRIAAEESALENAAGGEGKQY